jgi:pSer/pThr/pTyr-binding forkhead associated (FHA) protein
MALALVADAMAAMGDDVMPKVRVVEGADMGASLPLEQEGRVYVIGRSADADLPLEDAEASRQHLQVVRRASVILVRDLGSRNPAELAGAALPPDRDVVWRGQAVIRIGATVLALDEPVVTALAELEQAEDEPVALEDASPPPPASERAAPEEGDVPAKPATVAPVAEVRGGADATTQVARQRRRRPWSGTDFAVVVAALAVIALSAAGLYWLLR